MTHISRKVLFVDDEPNVLAGFQRQFRRDFEMTTAAGGAEGLKVIEESGPFAVVVADYKMPVMNGVDFLRKVRALSPDTATIMLTGQGELEVAVGALHEGRIFRFLRKPCAVEMLRAAVQDALEQYRLIVSERQLSTELADANGKLRTYNEQLEVKVEERTATIRRLHQMVRDLNGLETLEEVGQCVVNTAAEMLQSQSVVLLVPRSGREYLDILAAVGLSSGVIFSTRIPVGCGIAGRVFANGESVVINDREELASFEANNLEAEAPGGAPMLAALLVAPTGPVGVLNVSGHVQGKSYNAEDLANIRAICESATIALCNQMRLAERNEARDAIMLAMAKLAERRDPETGQHLERVRAYCRLLSSGLAAWSPGLQISRSFIESIYRSSPLHDIGKVGIPDSVLLKPGKLTAEEFEIMKRHAIIGGDTIRAVIEKGRSQDFLQIAMDIAYYHHEKYDGSGYPFGLKEQDIPLSARIMAVADVYDALTSRRVYKPAFPHTKAMAIIRDEAGKHFDPDVVAVFLDKQEAFATLSAELADPDWTPPEEQPAPQLPPVKNESMVII